MGVRKPNLWWELAFRWSPYNHTVDTGAWNRTAEITKHIRQWRPTNSSAVTTKVTRRQFQYITHGNFKKYWWPTANCAWFHASAAKYLKSALFWDITQYRVVIPYRLFGTTYRSHLQVSRNPRRNSDFLLGFLTLEDGTNMLSRNVGKELPLHAA